MQVFLRSLFGAGNSGARYKRVLAIVAALVCAFLFLQRPAKAQYGMPPSPAFGVGQRLQNEAQAAWNYADVLAKAGRPTEAAEQRRIAQVRARQAIAKFGVVMASAMYRRTAVGAEATLFSARLWNTILANSDQAAATYKQLLDNFTNVSFPDKATAQAEAHAVNQAVDYKYRTSPVISVQWIVPIPFPSAFAYKTMDFLVDLTGRTSQSYWLAIILISVIIKALTAQLSAKQFRSLKETQKLQPYLKELQAKYKNDRETLGRKTMELYQEHGINPMAGCGPMLIQIPVMFFLYETIRIYEYQFQHGTFLWIGSFLSKQYPQIFASDLGQPDIPLLGLYILSMYVQMRMTTPADPQQAEQQRMMSIYMPFMMGFFFLQGHWPSAFILYYMVFNVLSMVQQKWYMKYGKDTPGDASTTTAVSTSKASANGIDDSSSAFEKNGSASRTVSNGAKPTAKGAISPKVHPKKKRR